ncbi:MAG: ribonuclease HII [Chitinophagales bacterium]|nr:ribonuclease HII [Chitinophagales bacterium]
MLLSYYDPQYIEAGCDEAGRGCLAGPVVAAAVILPRGFAHADLNDSKQLSASKRLQLRYIIERDALAWAVASVSPADIDQINILQASFLAMHQAIAQLSIEPQHLLIDGNRFKPYRDIPHRCIVQGDAKYAAIAAASILAKTHRDAYMTQLHEQYPAYNWQRNKGYPTAEHRQAIALHGTTPQHRLSFALLKPQIEIDWDMLRT